MENFKFYQDVKVSVWIRQIFEIEAESREEAVEKVKPFGERDISEEIDGWDDEVLYDTQEVLYPSDNNGNSTIELYDSDMNLIGKNAD